MAAAVLAGCRPASFGGRARVDRKGPDARLPIIAAAPEHRMRGRFIGSSSARSRDGNGRRLL